MKIIDKYILKRYLLTFAVMILLFIPIGIMVDLAEKVGKMIDNQAELSEILLYYWNFTIYIGSLLIPIFLCLSIIFFTSKLAGNTEIVALLSSGISYTRFLKPYFIGATIVAALMFFLVMFVVPKASLGFNEFTYKYLNKGKEDRVTSNIFNQINENDFVYVSSYDPGRSRGYNFSLEHFDENDQLAYKITATTIRFKKVDSTYQLTTYKKRILNGETTRIESKSTLDTVLDFKMADLTPVSYIAETKNLMELNDFIKDQKRKGATNINTYIMVKYKRWALPISIYILTLIAVSVSATKRRGGMGVNLAFGILVAFMYIFFDRVFSTLAQQSGFPPLLAVILPNLLFAGLGIYLLNNAKR